MVGGQVVPQLFFPPAGANTPAGFSFMLQYAYANYSGDFSSRVQGN